MQRDVFLALLMASALAMVGCGKSGRDTPHGQATTGDQARPQSSASDQAAARIRQLGGKLIFDANDPNQVAGIMLSETNVADADLVHLKAFPNLKELLLRKTHVTDQGLMHLESLTNLRSLSLGETKVTDTGLNHLKKLTKLQDLYLVGTQVTDDGIKDLKKTLRGVQIYH